MTKSYFIMKKLIQKCFVGEYPEGSLLPGENQLCTQFGMSRSSIRTALHTMATKGVISVIPKKGYFVNRLNEWNWLDSDILELFSQENVEPEFVKKLLIARLIFEPNICAVAAAISNTADLLKIDEGYQMMVKGVKQGKRELFLQGDNLFHSAIVASCHNPFLSSLNDVFSTSMNLSFNTTLEIDLNISRSALEHHHSLLEAIRRRDIKQAKEFSKAIIQEAIRKITADKDEFAEDFIKDIIHNI